MRNLTKIEYSPLVEEVVQILMDKTQNPDGQFMRLMFSYFLAKIASMMRTNIEIPGLGLIPCNMYAINLAPSGSGKGRSITIIEEQVINKFKDRFIGITFQEHARYTMANIALQRASKNQTDQQAEIDKLETEFINTGPMVFSFDSGTAAAVKQMRHKLLLAGAGSMNMEIDEIGSNLLSNMEVLNAFLELFDIGKIKQKLIKNTRDNMRTEELFGRTPTNMLLFGTPTKLLNGSKTEEEFTEMLETGYARRSFFGFSQTRKGLKQYSAQEIFDIFTDVNADNHLIQLSDKLGRLADRTGMDATLTMSRDVTLELLEYRLHCDRIADQLSDYEDTRKAELKHRYFKVAKLAGVYAFAEGSIQVTEDHLYHAIALAEESGRAFERILKRDRPYARLASYICSIGRKVTHADLIEDLPFYKGTEAQKKDMMTLAIAHGYMTNQIIKKETIDGIEFIEGDSLPETDLAKCVVAYSKDITKGYRNNPGHWDNLHLLLNKNGYHWVNHELMENAEYPGEGGYRDEVHTIPGFNLIVVDVDETTDMATAVQLLDEYKFYLHTTKRHTPEAHRFRIVLPMSHFVKLDAKDYKEFMNGVYNWLPFEVDRQTNQRSRKWLTQEGHYQYNDGQLLDALQFIPKTKKAEENKNRLATQGSFTNLERWFVNNTDDGNRNNQLAKFAFAQIDMGYTYDSIANNVKALNEKLENPLPELEIHTTIMKSVLTKMKSREANES